MDDSIGVGRNTHWWHTRSRLGDVMPNHTQSEQQTRDTKNEINTSDCNQIIQ